VIGTKQLLQIDWGFRPTPISTTLAGFDTAFEYLSMTRRGPALDADPHPRRTFERLTAIIERMVQFGRPVGRIQNWIVVEI